jgi:hypothetical protein
MTIQLRYDNEFRRYVLRDSKLCTEDNSYEMVIDRGWDGERWYRYSFIAWVDGEWYHAITHAEYAARVQAIEENEGDEAGKIWMQHQNQVWVLRDNHPVFALRKRWEAMMELELFDIPVNHGEGPSKPLSAECVDKMAAYRDEWQRQETEDWPMANADAGRKAEMDDNPGE